MYFWQTGRGWLVLWANHHRPLDRKRGVTSRAIGTLQGRDFCPKLFIGRWWYRDSSHRRSDQEWWSSLLMKSSGRGAGNPQGSVTCPQALTSLAEERTCLAQFSGLCSLKWIKTKCHCLDWRHFPASLCLWVFFLVDLKHLFISAL